jgi:hypothetical protein
MRTLLVCQATLHPLLWVMLCGKPLRVALLHHLRVMLARCQALPCTTQNLSMVVF